MLGAFEPSNTVMLSFCDEANDDANNFSFLWMDFSRREATASKNLGVEAIVFQPAYVIQSKLPYIRG